MPALRAPPTPQLDLDRIKALHADIDAFIDARVAQEAKACPGVRAGGCQCRAYFLNSEKVS